MANEKEKSPHCGKDRKKREEDTSLSSHSCALYGFLIPLHIAHKSEYSTCVLGERAEPCRFMQNANRTIS